MSICAGLDVHRDTVVATVRFPQGRQRGSETKTFGTDTAELVALGDWLISHQVTRVGLESTGVYWKPVFYLLEDRIEQLWLLNAQHLKNVPGRKTDVADSAWIAQLVEHGLVRPSFVPPPPIRAAARFHPASPGAQRGTHPDGAAAGEGSPGCGDQVDVGGLHGVVEVGAGDAGGHAGRRVRPRGAGGVGQGQDALEDPALIDALRGNFRV